MKQPKEWKIEFPNALRNVPDNIIAKIQINAYNKCLFDLRKDGVLIDPKQNLVKYWKDED